MCGFVGWVDEGAAGYDAATTIRRMADAIAHRGPDSEDFYADERCALGFRRLAIIDLVKQEETAGKITSLEVARFRSFSTGAQHAR